MISVIIPVYNEEVLLKKNDSYYRMLSQNAELIFSDGGSNDETVELASKLGQVIEAGKGRAAQMNAGAQVAKGEILLFLHADSIVQKQYVKEMEGVIDNEKYTGGCLTQVLDEQSILFRWIAFTGNMRARISKVFYGDQGIFVRKEIFKKLGGFPEVKICEDILFSKKLRRAGKVDILPFPVYCSARRWKKQGVLKTYFINARIKTALSFGVHPNQLNVPYEDVREDK